MENKRRNKGLIRQVALLFLAGIVLTGILTYMSQHAISDRMVRVQTEQTAMNTASEVVSAVREYPASSWLMRYWYENHASLDIEYDADYDTSVSTRLKAELFTERNPGLSLRYLDEKTLESLPEEDQKLYAEIAYSWLITRIDQIKEAGGADFLFCVITDPPYDTQFFLFSAADRGSVRGTEYEQVYPIGVTSTVSLSQQEAMQRAVDSKSYLATAGDYMDLYTYLGSVDGHDCLIGLTFSTQGLNDRISSSTLTETVFAMAGQLVLSLICLVVIYVLVLRPLGRVQTNIRRYKETKESAPVIEDLSRLISSNEIGQLSDDVCGLTKELDYYMQSIERISAEKERMATELSLAARIQWDMLPTDFPLFADRTDFDIYASMDPAREVGGDFYDAFMIDDDHLCAVIADVSGKGIPAALFMMASMIILKNSASMGHSPGKILEDANNLICSSNTEEMFVTVWIGILELSTGKLTASNAGHEYPVIRRPGGEYELYRDQHSFVVGGMKGVKYKEYELMLPAGSRLFLYTDGLPEASDRDNSQFGTERILSALSEDRGLSPEETLKLMQGKVAGFVGDAEQFDDLTMMIVDYIGN